MRRSFAIVWLLVLTSLCCIKEGLAQEYGARLGIRRGEQVSFEPQGPGVLFGTLDPAVRKWYVPQELFQEYQWRQWDYTNYARQFYQRYVDIAIEGDYFYDLYGNYVTKGWLIFDHSQTNPQVQFGNSLYKDKRFGDWFSALIIAADSKGQYHYSITLSDKIRTTLTPLTFSKPRLDGIQWDFMSDKYAATFLYSRLNSPGGSTTSPIPLKWTSNTTLFGGRTTVQIGDFLTVGGTFVNAHNSTTQLSSFEGNLFSGGLTIDQNDQPVSWVEVILKDDSPEDEAGGASFFKEGSDIILTYLDGKRESGRDIDFAPLVQGGFQQQGYLAANGGEEIRVRWDFTSPAFIARAHGDKSEVKRVEFRLVLGNDYQVWVTSDRQTNRTGQPVPLLVTRAPGNPKDNSNLRVVGFHYGLPTATQVEGITLEAQDIMGFWVYGEFDRSHVFRQYPNRNLLTHKATSGIAGAPTVNAYLINVGRPSYPWFFFGEAYSMDDNYATTTFVTQDLPRPGAIDYSDRRRHFFEFVEDNDDQDRNPDWVRIDWLEGDLEVFPGWDENNDFIPDFNQNNTRTRGLRTNEIPDYEEPFLRYGVDRPEFLFGIDLNNNSWVDRFENDDLPDYPYKRDHEGYNVYTGVHLAPDVRLMLGQVREHLRSENKRNLTTYALYTADHDYPRLGRLRIFNMTKKAFDTIPDRLFQWVYLTAQSVGENRFVEDPLLGRDTWINSLFVGFDYTRLKNFNVINKLKYDLYHQRSNERVRKQYNVTVNEYFFGLINKADYTFSVNTFQLQPRWKSEYRKQTIDLVSAKSREELTEIGGVLLKFPIFHRTNIDVGFEYTVFRDRADESNNFRGRVLGFQLTNRVDYLGYRVTTQVGLKLDRRKVTGQEARTSGQTFMTVYAGAQ